ncbi:methyltransferase domain-containing protein [Chryseobacterium sp. Ch-15]|uniref:Methyltransferase domain-containing protein n=1 Tax=Chryseobacterium muglaense TaxID=2893752 RepID=A0A9Q3UWC4_9FLAO|nr:methyltransferase domain-containing protein [Chryseobacterium muglaense]MBD3905838.1 methyltransferase domain-containing protein [Chryseobacterium muglaense]MCC9035777.1 methyltransferase domain-containing protein [Chryseobacterium muglaense]MCM2555487.1 methyltransferase domain-containing protein [Chryseobacterium muglaense]
MPWNSEIYNQFKNIRYQPFFDLAENISSDGLKKAIDIGCGTGEQTHILSQKFLDAKFLGIDSSAEMLEKSSLLENEKLSFKLQTIEELYDSNEKWDLIFSNAALQWSDNHDKLFPKLLSLLSENGQFAVQMPVQAENTLNQILFQLASEEPYKAELQDWNRVSPVLSLDEYAKMMFDAGLKDLNISIKVYPIIADDAEKLFQFISGSALIPYLERLDGVDKEKFINEYKKRIAEKFETFSAIYAFKRMLLYGRK